MIPISLLAAVACVTLLTRGVGVGTVTGIFVAGKLLGALMAGPSVVGLLISVVLVGLLSFAWFWLLDRLEGSTLWWLALLGGILLLV